MSVKDCVYGPCGRCEFNDSINGDGVCMMYTAEWSFMDNDEEEDDSSDDEFEP